MKRVKIRNDANGALLIDFFEHFSRGDKVLGRGNLYPFVRKNRFKRYAEHIRRVYDRLRETILERACVFRDKRRGEEACVYTIEIRARKAPLRGRPPPPSHFS